MEATKQITILSGKGGTGKTTLAAALTQLSNSYSLVGDCDVDAPNLHLILDPQNISAEPFKSGKIAIKDPMECTSCGKCFDVCRFDAIDNNYDINPTRCEGCGACAWICPNTAITMQEQTTGNVFDAETRFSPLTHAKLNIGAENSGKLVSKVIEKSSLRANSLNKNLIIIDGSPGIGCPVIASLTNANLVIIVVEPTITAVHDMERILDVIIFFKLKPSVVINKNNINPDQRKYIIEYCTKKNIPVLGELPYNLAVYKAMTEGKTILEQNIHELDKPLRKIWVNIQNFFSSNEV